MSQPDLPLVLMVEDEPLLLLHAAEILPTAGYRILCAERAGEALSHLRHSGNEVGVAIVDLGLPDMPGEQLVQQLRAIRPGLPIIVASGYSRRRLKTLFAGMEGIAFLEKPYGSPEMMAALQGLLAGRAGRGVEPAAEPIIAR